MDNTGYPAVLDGIKVPISSQFIAVIDSYDAMTDGNRPYNSHTAFTKEQALNRLGELRDGFDPGVRSAYTNMLLAPTHLPFGLPLPSQTFAAQPGGL
jgi:HD-GYP domain-containing protein (c-di-GMP phosphodiesterase class II)